MSKNTNDHTISPVNPDMYPGGLRGCLEAILISADQPVSTSELEALLNRPEEDINRELEGLQQHISADGKAGWQIVHSARGWRLESTRAYDSLVVNFLGQGSRNGHLSRACQEALAIIAYKQPLTRADVSEIRGVSSDGVIRSLIVRGLVAQSASADQSTARQLVTTDLFLEKMGIASLADLPPLAPFLPHQADVQQTENQARARVQEQHHDESSELAHVTDDDDEDDQ
jgi:segregation and condensation protein B